MQMKMFERCSDGRGVSKGARTTQKRGTSFLTLRSALRDGGLARGVRLLRLRLRLRLSEGNRFVFKDQNAAFPR